MTEVYLVSQLLDLRDRSQPRLPSGGDTLVYRDAHMWDTA